MRRIHSHNSDRSWVDGLPQGIFRGLVLFWWLLGIGLNPVVNAAGIRPVPIEMLAAKADWIVHGRVQSLESHRSAPLGITTVIELEVTETWKGVATNRIILSVAGGVLGNRRMVVTGQPEFRVGEEAIWFLMRNDRGEGVLLELSQGKFEVHRDSEKRALVSNGIYGSPKKSPSSPTAPTIDTSTNANTARVPPGTIVIPHQLPLTLTELKRRVLSSLAR
jgi:hypothetical protein